MLWNPLKGLFVLHKKLTLCTLELEDCMRLRHVCFFLNSVNFGGSEQYLYALAENFITDGVKVTFISAGGKMTRELNEVGCKTVQIPIAGIFKDRIEDLPLKHRVILNNWWLFGWLYSCFLNVKLKNVDVIICQHGFPSILASDFAKKNKCKLVNIVHHLLPNEYTDLYHQFNVVPDVFVAISQEISDFLANEKNVKNNIIINNPISLPSVVQCIDKKIGVSKKVITLLSHVHEEKEESLLSFLGASNRIELSFCEFNVVGDCSSDFAKKLIADNPKVHFHGALHRPEALTRIVKSDVVIAVGRSVVEAAMLGKRTIVCGHIKGKNGGNYGGILSQSSFYEIAAYNFSGRNSSRVSSAEILTTDITACIQNPMQTMPPEPALFAKFLPENVYGKFVELIDSFYA
jgi:hypothetical protein